MGLKNNTLVRLSLMMSRLAAKRHRENGQRNDLGGNRQIRSIRECMNYGTPSIQVIASLLLCLSFVLGVFCTVLMNDELADELNRITENTSSSLDKSERFNPHEYRCVQGENAEPCIGDIVVREAGVRCNVQRICEQGLIMKSCECSIEGDGQGRVVGRAELGHRMCVCDFTRDDDVEEEEGEGEHTVSQWHMELLCVKPNDTLSN